MDETTAGPDRQSERRPPYWAVGLALLGVIVVVLAVAFLLNEHLRPHVGIQPLTHAPGKGSPTVTLHPGASGTVTPQPTASPAPTTVATMAPTPVLTPRQQVIQAYYRYWRAYSQTLYTLNTSPMGAVAAGSELTQVQSQVASLRQQRRAVHVVVIHHALIVSVKGNKATVYDEIRNRSFTINPVTKQPPHGSNLADLEKDIYFLQKIHGSWKVVKSLRQEK
ncbi:MAG TPA: hypothetical protein VFB58_04995 [Chloroflexota bacterium]|nr:hypothetical protein [Chloroflexota bacterium]